MIEKRRLVVVVATVPPAQLYQLTNETFFGYLTLVVDEQEFFFLRSSPTKPYIQSKNCLQTGARIKSKKPLVLLLQLQPASSIVVAHKEKI